LERNESLSRSYAAITEKKEIFIIMRLLLKHVPVNTAAKGADYLYVRRKSLAVV